MDFAHAPVTLDYATRVQRFLDECVYPNEHLYWRRPSRRRSVARPASWRPQAEARRGALEPLAGRAHAQVGGGLSNLEYAPLAELSGRSPFIARRR